ncbi:response regulator [Maribacter algarum]|uniref:histidine kinase n=1 Tax=Maribacter algarum (ex Zhang et al. 2020) TaxID=2578118 RepID=A0A5S3PQ14_9FLAO|nr:two-component regulator propeller domain-containing protein [Maribacter algarum]TMM56774.1 response regulator [Maribacter algarum]
MKEKGPYIIIYKLAIVLLVFIFGNNSCFAQENIFFDHLTTEDGLSQSDINSIYQDDQGFMWFATHDGLNKYDGYEFTVYNPDPNDSESINSNLIFDIVGDKNKNLWIGTTGSGLNLFDRSSEKFRAFKHKKDDPKSLINNHISTLYKDHNELLWIGTNRGVDMLDLKKPLDSAVFEHIPFNQESLLPNFDGRRIYKIFENSKNQLLVGGIGGIFKLSRDRNGNLYFKSINTELGLENTTVLSIAEDRDNRLIIGTIDAMYMHKKGVVDTKMSKVFDGLFNNFILDQNHNIWCGTNNGLLLFDNSAQNELPTFEQRFTYNPLQPNSIKKNIIKSLAVDKTGIVWVGTNGGGVSKFDPDRKQFAHIRKTLDPNSLSYDKIRSIFEDSNGNIWIGTEGGGLNLLDNENTLGYSRFKTFNATLKPFAITETNVGNKKSLLIGVENTPGLYHLDISNPANIKNENILPFEEVGNSVFALLTDSNQNVWVGTYGGGVQRWVPNQNGEGYVKNQFVYSEGNTQSIPSNIIRSIFEDSEGNIWFGTANGLCRLSPDQVLSPNPQFEVFQNDPQNKNSLSHNYILALYESTMGDFWIGTFGGGINKFVSVSQDGKPSFISYTESQGLPNNVIKGILEDENQNLWLSTNQGLTRFDSKAGEFKNFDVNDGLQSNEFQELAALKRRNGEMLFGGVNGFNAFYPNQIIENPHPAETVITDFSIFNTSVKVGGEVNNRIILEKPLYETEEIQLKHWENSFSFEFASLHFAAPQKNNFAYMLEGFDEDWINTSSSKRFATYTNLEPGEYILKVKASNNDGLWDKTPSSIKLTIVPPFWQTTWAYLLYGILGILALFAYRKFTIIKTTEKHSLQLEHLEKEKFEDMQQMKLEFFTNISHEFRTPLTLIKGPLEYLKKKGHKLSPEKANEQYSLMQKNTDYLMRLVNQLLDFRKMGQGKLHLVVRNTNIVSFIKEIGEPFQFTAHKRGIDFNVTSSVKNLTSWFDHEALEKVMNNLLSNAFKFTSEFGKITIEISEGANEDLKELLPLEKNPSSYVFIQVKDSGTGIPKENVSHIFERFYVEKEKSKKNLNGAGIGLSFVKNLVELHQGKITVVSEPNVETNFTIALPIQKEAYENIEEITIKEESESDFKMRSSEAESFAVSLNDEILDTELSNNRSKSPVLLVVDDNPDIRSFIKNMLEDQYTIYEAENGKEGLEKAISIVPNIILTDVVMPVMDGLELCEKIKTKTATSHIPVIMITAKSSQESEVEGLQNGADDYIRKPFDIELLQLKLNNIVKQREDLRRRFNREITLQPKEVTVTSTDELFLQNAIEIVEKHMTNTDFNVEMMVKEMGHSRSNLYLKFKEITGLSSSEFIRNIRLKRAVQLFDQSDLSVKEIMYMTGFNTASYFSKCFKKQFGVIPSEYVAKRKAERKPIKI